MRVSIFTSCNQAAIGQRPLTRSSAVFLTAHTWKIGIDSVVTDLTYMADFWRICQNGYIIFHIAYVIFHVRGLRYVRYVRMEIRHYTGRAAGLWCMRRNGHVLFSYSAMYRLCSLSLMEHLSRFLSNKNHLHSYLFTSVFISIFFILFTFCNAPGVLLKCKRLYWMNLRTYMHLWYSIHRPWTDNISDTCE